MNSVDAGAVLAGAPTIAGAFRTYLSQTVPPSHVDEFQFIYGRHHAPVGGPDLEPLHNSVAWYRTKKSFFGRKGAVFASLERIFVLRADTYLSLLDRRDFGGLASFPCIYVCILTKLCALFLDGVGFLSQTYPLALPLLREDLPLAFATPRQQKKRICWGETLTATHGVGVNRRPLASSRLPQV